jgi:hypothetical protein
MLEGMKGLLVEIQKVKSQETPRLNEYRLPYRSEEISLSMEKPTLGYDSEKKGA